MSMTSTKTALGFAAFAAAMAIANFTASSPASAQEAKDAKAVHCYGVNSCKGTSDCKAAKHDCRGMNDCKGQGFKELTTKACAEQGGSLTEPKG
jgi:uncharacterized membrane protein